MQGSQKHLLQIAQVCVQCISAFPPLQHACHPFDCAHGAEVPDVMSQAAYPIILVRCRSILQQFAADQRADPGSVDPQRMEEVVCVLEVHCSNDDPVFAMQCTVAYCLYLSEFRIHFFQKFESNCAGVSSDDSVAAGRLLC